MASQTNIRTISRSASWVGGISLLLIAVLAGVGNFGALAPLITLGDATKTAAAISGSETQFRLGVLCMLIAAVLDVVVAAALLHILEPVSRTLALVAAWFRIAYTAVFVVAISQLALVPSLLSEPELGLNAIDAYYAVWRIGLILFAAHLLVVGYVCFRSGFVPRWLGILIGVAGIGYLIDGVGTILVAGYQPTVSTVTFIGEVALIGWLFWAAVRRSRALPRTAPVSA
ncbi:MAG: DUF4386 domain-containing protein [Pseudolysinimonas sp.]